MKSREVAERLGSLGELSGRGAAEIIDDLLGNSAADPDRSAELDHEVVESISKIRNSAPLLGQIDPRTVLGLIRRVGERLAGSEPDLSSRHFAWKTLDLVRRPALATRIAEDERPEWAAAILTVVERSRFTVGPLFRHRAASYGSKILFEFNRGGRRRMLSWRQTSARIDHLARLLLALQKDRRTPIALFSENRIEMALVDLACLGSGLVNVLVPANASETDVGYILRHSGAGCVVVSGADSLRKVLKNREDLPNLENIVTMESNGSSATGVQSLDELASLAETIPASEPRRRGEAVGIDDVATVMYTSGTTGTPKGIQFSHRNVVFKRFARALALPEIGESDCLLSFLPLFHTFGRFLEMLGCVFWGARYCFLDNPSPKGLVQGMRLHRPTVFISVPKKWIQLYERVMREAGSREAPQEEMARATREITGGRLRWGLSAAGHLDSEIFRFFQEQGVELVSGFGMTEATGGITMTAPGRYRDGSLGQALPGIELKLADDGELLVRGPYVMIGYLDPPDGEVSKDESGWFRTGDLMETYDDGHYRLVDRKKEIYKNVKGETIAPQRVENLFRDFDSVGRAFLVGDHRDYNTLLVYPNPEFDELDFSSLPTPETLDHFRSLVVSVNRFLAPYERIVDLALIPRDLDPEKDELTAKGTPRRKTVERNFAEIVRELYRRADLRVGDVDLTFPNWLFQILGLTAQDLRIEGDCIVLPARDSRLTVRRLAADRTRVGSCEYRHPEGSLNLGAFLTTPRLWLGNHQLTTFVSLDAATRRRAGRSAEGVCFAGYSGPYQVSDTERKRVEGMVGTGELDLSDLDLVARCLGSSSERDALSAVEVLESILSGDEGVLSEPSRLLLSRVARSDSRELRRRGFGLLVPSEPASRLPQALRAFVWRDPGLLDKELQATLCELNLSEAQLDAFIESTRSACKQRPEPGRLEPPTGPLLDFLAAYGAAHPMSYRKLRAFLERSHLFAAQESVRNHAAEAASALQLGFRSWLGTTLRIAVDPETGQEYRWDDVVVFDQEIDPSDRDRLLSAIKDTAFLREGVFLFSNGAAIRLSDIPPGGVWVRMVGSRHGKSVYRVTVQTRFQGSYELAANVNHDLTSQQVGEEIQWLILGGDAGDGSPLVEDFGGYWPKQDLWSEEFIAGETLLRAMRRVARQESERLQQIWPFLAWATLSAWVEFWDRSGKRLEIADPSLTNVIVPTEDFQSGARIVSVSRRRPHSGLLAMMDAFRTEFVEPAEALHPQLQGEVGWEVIFSSVLEVAGETEGVALFRGALKNEDHGNPELAKALEEFLAEVERRGFMPMRLHFACRRYRRWAELSVDATSQARARTLRELYDTYGLQRLASLYPAIRVRFFLETVFRSSSSTLRDGVEEIVHLIRSGTHTSEDLIGAVDDLRTRLNPAEDDDYFLARLSYPFLRPEDSAVFVRSELGGQRQSEIVVTLDDRDGNPFRVRHALNPREVERLHRLFLSAKLDIRFRMEHRYLVALNERERIIAGIFYEIEEGDESAHLEKIVVSDRYRRKGVADGLMLEFFNRLRAAGVKTVTTGFFRPEYFYSYGFRIEKRYAGLVKNLEEAADAEPVSG